MNTDSIEFKNGYVDVNGIKMYYEIYGTGKPLVLIHGGGSTIQTSFGRIIPALSLHRQIIAVELQAHGRTSDRNADLSFEQDADDVAGLLKKLNITNADIFGFSNGATTTLQLAIRHPEIAGKIIVCSAIFKKNGTPPGFREFMKHATIKDMPQQLKDGFLKVNSDPGALQSMHDKCAKRMLEFKDIPDKEIEKIKSPTLIVAGDQDVLTPEHALEMHRLIRNSRLAIIPGGHGKCIGEITTITPDTKETDFIIPVIEEFLNSSTESTLLK